MDTKDRKQFYLNSKYKYTEKQEMKVSTMSQSSSCNYLYELMFLTKNVTNWESFLNDKQINILKLYLSHKNINDVARMLDLPYTSIHSALFGTNIKNEQGIFGRLKKIYSLLKNKKLNEIGEVLLKRQEKVEDIRLNTHTIDLKEDLLKFINAIPDYKDFLTERQAEVVDLFLKHKKYSIVDSLLGTSSWSILYGKTKINPKGVYGNLKKVYDKRFSNKEEN